MTKALEEAEILYNAAFDCYQKGDTKHALLNLKQILMKTKGPVRVKAYELLGKISIDKEKLEHAVKFYCDALKYVEADNWHQKSILYNNLGLLYHNQKKLEKALEYQELCLKAVKEMNDQTAIAKTLRNLGRLYTLQGDHVKALRYHQKSLEIKRVVGDRLGEARTYETIAQDYEYGEEFEKALEEYNHALDIFDSLGLKTDIKRIQDAIENVNALIEDTSEFDDLYMYDLHTGDFL